MPNIPTYHYPQAGRLVVLGAGESGVGSALLGKKQGFDVWVSDIGQIEEGYKAQLIAANIAFEEGKHDESEVLKAALAVKSPGIPGTVPIVRKLREASIPVIGELEFAAQYTDAKLIC